MDILRCRAHTRQHIRDHSVNVDQLERMVISTVCKLNVVQKENERFITYYMLAIMLMIYQELVIYLCYSHKDSCRNM